MKPDGKKVGSGELTLTLSKCDFGVSDQERTQWRLETKTRIMGLSFDDAEQQTKDSRSTAQRPWRLEDEARQGKKRFKFTTFEPTLRGANINSFDM